MNRAWPMPSTQQVTYSNWSEHCHHNASDPWRVLGSLITFWKMSSDCIPSVSHLPWAHRFRKVVVLGGCRAASSGEEGKGTVSRGHLEEKVLQAGTKAGREARTATHLC